MDSSVNEKSLSRREFLKMSGLLGLAATAAAVIPVSESVAFGGGLYKVTRNISVMGTYAVITVMDESRSRADDAMGKAFDEMRRLTRIMDRFDSSSAVSALNRDGRINDAPKELLDVAEASRRFHASTGGAFDVTVAPLVDLYKDSFTATGLPPTPAALSRALALVDGGGLSVSGRTISLAKPGMSVTLDGIAKGYIIDAGAESLKKSGAAHFLVNAGGDIRAVGGKGGNASWTIAVRDPESTKNADAISINDGAVATSGNYEVYFDREKLYHHIVNPKTGACPVTSASVSVAAPTVTAADALSTSVFVMGPDRGRKFIEGVKDARCFVITRTGGREASKGWNDLHQG